MAPVIGQLKKALTISVFGALLVTASPVKALDGGPMISDADDQLKQAEGSSDSDQLDHLQQALGILENLPPGSNDQVKWQAIKYVRSALYEAKNGDPNGYVDKLIKDADNAVRDLQD